MNQTLLRVLSRVLRAVIVCLAVYVLVFLVLTVLPGDPIGNRLRNPENSYSEDEINRIMAYFDLDQPWWVQLGNSGVNALLGDWGISLSTLQPVTTMVAEAAPTTIALAALSLTVGLAISIAVTVGAVFAPLRAVRTAFRVLPSFGVSIPVFVVGLLLLQFFAFQLGWFNIVRDSGLKTLILPALTIAVPISAPLSQLMINTLDKIRKTDYATLAQSKGLSTRTIAVQHYLRPAAPPVLTLIGLTLGELLAGTIIAESIFGLSGIGYLVEKATLDQDAPVLLLVTVASAVIYITINLVLDLIHPLLDPTLRGPKRTRPTSAGSPPAPAQSGLNPRKEHVNV